MTEKIEKVINLVGSSERFAKGCKHNRFTVDTQLGYVKCGICNEHLNPMWVIEQYANSEHRLFQQVNRLSALTKILKDKTKCKCEHCGQMTKIESSREMNKAYWEGTAIDDGVVEINLNELTK
ncbi:TPA: hypothetical protein ACPVYZ_004250 [Vibrio parahaemolyticus]